MTDANNLLLAALEAAGNGWHVFPLVPGEKRPAVKDWEARATVDLGRIERCWSTGAFNVGIACGPSGLVVVDLDRPKPTQEQPAEWTLPGCHDGADVFATICERAGHPSPIETHIVRTGRGGSHLYFTHPVTGPALRNTAGTLGWLVDTRAHGGYVVAPGSIVAGNPYTVEWNATPAALPGWLCDLLSPAPLPVQRPVVVDLADRRRSGYLNAAVAAEVERVRSAPQGTRNRALYLAAVALGQLVAGGALPAGEVTSLLEHAGAAAGLGLIEAAKTVASGIRAGAARPRSVAA